MYITETTDNVRILIEELENKDDIKKIRFLIYIFGLLNNNQINDKNEANPNLIEDDDLKIFTFDMLGCSHNACTIFLQFLVMIYNRITDTNEAFEDNGNVLGINYDADDNKLASQFEKLDFNEKLDVFSEIIIKYDNETYFDDKIPTIKLNSKISGFDMARMIKKYKEKNKEKHLC